MTPQVYEETKLGTLQGESVAAISNIMLNGLDKELEAKGLSFTRFVDDCVIAARSELSVRESCGQ